MLIQRVYVVMIKDSLGRQLICHINCDSTGINARETIAKKDRPQVATQVTQAKLKNKRGRSQKEEVRNTPEPSPQVSQHCQTLAQMLAEMDTVCGTGTKKNAQDSKKHVDTACCGVPISAVHTSVNGHNSRLALPLTRISAQRVDACYELMDAAYCSRMIREEIQTAGRVPLINHNPCKGGKREKLEFAPREAQQHKTRTGAERCNARLKDEFVVTESSTLSTIMTTITAKATRPESLSRRVLHCA